MIKIDEYSGLTFASKEEIQKRIDEIKNCEHDWDITVETPYIKGIFGSYTTYMYRCKKCRKMKYVRNGRDLYDWPGK